MSIERNSEPPSGRHVERICGHEASAAENEFRVWGPPGTGKTGWITAEVGKEARSRGGERVMITSLTTAAARTIASRNVEVPSDNVGTLHSHCFEAVGGGIIAELKRSEFNAEYPRFALTVEDSRSVDDAGDQVSSVSPGDDVFNRYKLYRSMLVPREKWAPTVLNFAAAWEKWKAARKFRDFTDLIEDAYRSVNIAPGNPDCIFVDEAQDHDALELALIRKWGRHAERVVIVGDPDQAIYEWRGADPRAFQEPPVRPEQRHVLTRSFRVPRKVQQVASKWVEQIRDREPVSYAPKEEDGEVRRMRATFKRPLPIVADVKARLSEGRECMILAASSYMLEPVLRELRRAGVPYHNPYRRKAGHWNPLQPHNRGTTSAERLLAFLRPSREAWLEDNRRWTHSDLREWVQVIGTEGIMKRGAKALIANTNSPDQLRSIDLLEYFEEDAVRQMMRLNLEWFRAHVQPARRAAMEFPINVALKSGPAALKRTPSVTVGTIHSVKGGEADTVYVFPDLSPVSNAAWHASGRGRAALIRLFYVAMTRAERALILCEPAGFQRVSGLAPGL